MTFNLDRFCAICGYNLEREDAFIHVNNEHAVHLFNAIFEVLTSDQQSRIINKLVEVKPKNEYKTN